VNQAHTFDDLPVPALLRQARGTYGLAIRIRLSAEGLSDLPKNGPYLVGGLANGVSAEQLLCEMGLSDSQAERLLGALLDAHFVEADDSLGMNDTLALRNTEKGLRAARAVSEAIHSVNHELSHLLTPEEFRGFQNALVALSDIKARTEESLHN
jgi:DNA-binding transcriptional ArsR family regulator